MKQHVAATALLTSVLFLPALALGQTEADSPSAIPVPNVSTEMMAPDAPMVPEEGTTPVAETNTATSGTSLPTSANDPVPALGNTEQTAPLASTDPASVPASTASDTAAPASAATMPVLATNAVQSAVKFLRDGGPSIWAIAALSVITLALILWKVWRLALIGAWSRGKAQSAIAAYEADDPDRAKALVTGRRGVRSVVVATALHAIHHLPDDHAREETARVAKRELASARSGLGALELISTIAPLLGLLGTVMGMIAAFQALQAAGAKADPSMLAGGIWEALLTTAAGMAVAIPASAALTWFEAVIDRMRRDVEDGATRLFVRHVPQDLRLAAE